MKQPTWSNFFLRVGGVFALFCVTILGAKKFFPGYEGYAVGGTAAFVFAVLVVKELSSLKRTKRLRNRREKSK